MNGIDPTGVKDRELATAEKKSHSARMAHRRRRERREALLRLQQARISPRDSDCSTIPEFATAVRKRDREAQTPMWVSSLIKPRSQTDDKVSVHESGRQKATARDSTLTMLVENVSDTVPIGRQPPTSVHLALGDENCLRAFEYWVNVCGPTLQRFEFRVGATGSANTQSPFPSSEVYTRVLPQLAIESNSVRHMLLACACYTRLFRTGPEGRRHPVSQVWYHYIRGLKAMRTETGGIEHLAAAKMGYAFEALQNNFGGALMHLKGYKAVLSCYTGRRDEDFQRLTTSHDTVDIKTSISTFIAIETHEEESSYVGTSFAAWNCATLVTTNRARDSLRPIMEDIGDSFPLSDSRAINRIKSSLRDWIDNLREWDARQGPSIRRSGLLYLYSIATALLSADDVEELCCTSRSHLIGYALGDFGTSLVDQSYVSREDTEYVTETFRTLGKHTSRYLQHAKHLRRLKSLLDRVELSGPCPVVCRGWVVAKQAYYHVMSEEVSRAVHSVEGFLSATGQ